MATSVVLTPVSNGDPLKNPYDVAGASKAYEQAIDRLADTIRYDQPIANVSDTTGGVAALLTGGTVNAASTTIPCYADLMDDSGLFLITVEEGTGLTPSTFAPAATPLTHIGVILFDHRTANAPVVVGGSASHIFSAQAAATTTLTATKINLFPVEITANLQYKLRLAVTDAASTKTYRVSMQRLGNSAVANAQ